VAVNLAMVYASSGKRVTIMDADMRRHQVHHGHIELGGAVQHDWRRQIRVYGGIERPEETTLSVITSGSL
jgi:Mrp family chromosome partitioning ATPase